MPLVVEYVLKTFSLAIVDVRIDMSSSFPTISSSVSSTLMLLEAEHDLNAISLAFIDARLDMSASFLTMSDCKGSFCFADVSPSSGSTDYERFSEPCDSRNPKKPRWQDEEPPDTGGSLPPITDPPPTHFPSVVAAPRQPLSYKDSLMSDSNDNNMHEDEPLEEDDIEILEGEVTRTVVDGLISIQFSDRIQALAEKNFLTVLADGPWTIFGHYLTGEPWSPDFSPSQPHPSRVIAWIRLPGLPATLYKRSLIEEIGNCIGHVVRIDYQTESGCRGRFARDSS
ncbi:hypothetical protein V6N12_060140 [Hibiscus sabdariffa]|uniref:DUF4283 domain-containing protein n=1 Tax=Hibiscus sabdariffa TaxID=183260 RepID=A0ABR2D6C0_9ROSI